MTSKREHSELSLGVKVFRTAILPVQKLPLGFHYAWGRFFAWLASSILRYRRDVVMVNISRSFPGLKWKEVRDMAKDFYRHFGDILAEAVWFGGCRGNAARLRRSGLCRVINPEVLDSAFDKGKSVMVLCSHQGNWELLGGIFEFLEDRTRICVDDIVVVYKSLSSRFWDQFIRGNRLSVVHDGFEGYVESHDILRKAVSERRNGKVYVFPTDQFPYSGATRHDVGLFLNQPTLAMTGGAALASRFGMPVLYLGMNRTGAGKYEMSFTEICPDASLMSAEEIMVGFYRLLEEDVLKDPANYLWSHNRWK